MVMNIRPRAPNRTADMHNRPHVFFHNGLWYCTPNHWCAAKIRNGQWRMVTTRVGTIAFTCGYTPIVAVKKWWRDLGTLEARRKYPQNLHR